MGQGVDVGAARVGPVGIGVAGFLLVLVALSVWVGRHQQRLRRVVDIADIPLIGPLLRSVAVRVAALSSPARVRLGLHGLAAVGLLSGLIVVVTLAVGFTALLDDVLDGEGIAEFDDPAARWLAAHRELWLTRVLLVVTRMGNPAAQTVVIGLVCALAGYRARSWLPVLVGVAGGLGTALVIVSAKHLVGRQRPAQPFAMVSVHGFSFPSGHATGAAAVGALCAWMLCRWVVSPWAARVGVWAVTIAMIGLIGFSRPYLGVHFVTDVLAGWLLGAAWAGSVIVVASWWLESQRPRPPDYDAA